MSNIPSRSYRVQLRLPPRSLSSQSHTSPKKKFFFVIFNQKSLLFSDHRPPLTPRLFHSPSSHHYEIASSQNLLAMTLPNIFSIHLSPSFRVYLYT